MVARAETQRSRHLLMSHTRPPTVPLRAIAALFIERQHLERPRARRLNAPRLVRLVEDTGGLQLDSINVVERAHYLTLWSRFGSYDKRVLDRLAYRRRLLFEYWAHAACLIATSRFGPWRRAMLDYRTRHRGWRDWLQKNRAALSVVETAIRDGGPAGNADFEHRRPRSGESGWWNWKPTAHALDYLWMTGRTLVHSRIHFQKRFDLAERVLADALREEPPSTESFRRWHLRQSLHAMGVATETDLRMYLTFPRIEAVERRRVIGAMLKSGEVVELAVDDVGGGARARGRGPRSPGGTRTRWFALAEDLPALERAGRRRVAARGTTLLSPFDSFLWHRDRVRRLFGYDYTLEVYTPSHKRNHGYYSLPIYHDGQLIGRLDPKTHREERWLEVKSLHLEPWFARGAPPPAAVWGPLDRDAALRGIAEALWSLAAFVGAERVTLGKVRPAAFRAALQRELRAGPAQVRAALQRELRSGPPDRGA